MEEAKTAAAGAATAQAAGRRDARLPRRGCQGALRGRRRRDCGQATLKWGAQAEPRARSQHRDRSQTDDPHPIYS
ncbi:hypothetical protein [Methylobacterium sp. E-066]|uniref:hypothetical protein n=1 Tax=Methylobacterium sp. E-066 TaxID=2836584 RepID=UPI001FBB4778|nr:hypothetical protein [Methylobacterium sp. E-066]MCJ2142831.1 hypothetical protein [Methylobacterium sp. E-066]